VLRSFVLAVLASAALAAQTPTSITTNIPFVDARPILDALHDGLPADLRSRTLKELEPVWPAWVRRRDAAIRARLEQGDEDSVYNMLLFGTTFTREPRELNDSARIGGPRRSCAAASATWSPASHHPDPTSGCSLPAGSWNAAASIRRQPRGKSRCGGTSSRR
jgi:hypothetical protein